MKEIIELRKEKEKHFLCEDGTMKAYKYRDIIHFNKDGKYEEINNTIIKAKEYYTNKANDFKISFSNDIEDSLIYKIEKGETYLNVRLRDKKEKSCQNELPRGRALKRSLSVFLSTRAGYLFCMP